MGNFFIKLKKNLGLIKEENYDFVKCRCPPRNCATEQFSSGPYDSCSLHYDEQSRIHHLATYRFNINTITNDKYQDELDKIYQVYPTFSNYWFCSYTDCTNNFEWNHQFIGCEYCIDENDKKYFTHYPNGWKENFNFRENYEEIKI